jgi:hypothetical protein
LRVTQKTRKADSVRLGVRRLAFHAQPKSSCLKSHPF